MGHKEGPLRSSYVGLWLSILHRSLQVLIFHFFPPSPEYYLLLRLQLQPFYLSCYFLGGITIRQEKKKTRFYSCHSRNKDVILFIFLGVYFGSVVPDPSLMVFLLVFFFILVAIDTYFITRINTRIYHQRYTNHFLTLFLLCFYVNA